MVCILYIIYICICILLVFGFDRSISDIILLIMKNFFNVKMVWFI